MAVPSTWPRDIAAAGGVYEPLTLFNAEPLIDVFTIEGVDYTSATFEDDIRAAFEESSAVLASFSFEAILIGSDTVVTRTLSEAAVLELRSGFDLGAIETLFHSTKVTPPGGEKLTWFAGELKLMGA